MRNIIITVLVATGVTAGMYFALGNIPFSILTGVIAAFVVFIILMRKASKELEALNEKAQKALYSQNFDRALRIYESGLSLGKKSPFITGQIHGLIGMIHYIRRDHDKAKVSLIRSSSMNWVSKGMLAVIYMNEKNYTVMEKTFKTVITAGRKEGLAWSLYAYCLDRIGRKEDALNVLEEGNKKLKEADDRIKSNILELKNGRKMRMKSFGEAWYQFMLEKPQVKRMVQQGGVHQGGMKKNAMYRG